MKIYLDDERPCPKGWTPAYSPEEVIDFLRNHEVTHLSLDHDLGLEETGYDLVKQMIDTMLGPTEEIIIHSMNPVGALNMRKALLNAMSERLGRLKRVPILIKPGFSADHNC